ncbi:hypothetical protein Tco_1226197 [Tanacetum coccineum]
MQDQPLFESDGFIYWKNRFETYVKLKDLDLWHVITDGDFPPIQFNPETKKDEIVSFHKQNDDLKKKLAKNNEAKMVIYKCFTRKEYEMNFFVSNRKGKLGITLLITHQGLKALDEGDKLPRATSTDISLTKFYIPKVSKIPVISSTIAKFYKSIENRNIHEGRVVDQAYYKSNNIEHLFTNIRFDYLFKINEPIVPRFILDFYSQVTVQTDEYGYLVYPLLFNMDLITITLAKFGQILKMLTAVSRGHHEWDLGFLIPLSQTVTSLPNQTSLKELSPDMKQWEELIRENVFGLGGHRDHLPACLAHMLYCVVAEEQYNLAYFFVKRIKCARANPTANLPYGMFLTRLYRHIMEVYPHLDNGIYDIVDRVMRPLALKTKSMTRGSWARARHSVSSSLINHHGTSSHQHDDDDDDDDDVETSCASTPSPTTYLNSLNPLNYQNYKMPSASEQTDETLFERQTTLLNQTQEMHKEMRGGFKSFGKALKGVFSKKKK